MPGCSGVRDCKTKDDLYKSLTDPLLSNFIDGKPAGVIPDNMKGFGWISIDTNNNSGLDLDLSTLSTNNDVINFLSITKYNPAECELIFNVLNNGGLPASGKKIIFDNQGNIAINVNGTNKIMYNPLIPTNIRNNLNLDAVNESNTISTTHGSFIKAKVYFISSKVFINPTLNYILYTKDRVPSKNSIYHLLYNPMHRENFQNYYRSLTELTGTWETDGNLYKPTKGEKGYIKSDYEAFSTEGLSKTASSYRKIIAKYCNAFKITGEELSNYKVPDHYADPSCAIALSESDAINAFILGANYTQATIARKYYSPLNDDEAGTKGNAEYLKNILAWQALPQTSILNWACPTHNNNAGSSVYTFCAKSGILNDGSNSFMNVLANGYANLNGTTQTKNPLNRDAVDNKKSVVCSGVSLNITTCINNVKVDGSVDGSNINMQNVCNPPRPSPPPPPVVALPVTPPPVVPYVPITPVPIIPVPITPVPITPDVALPVIPRPVVPYVPITPVVPYVPVTQPVPVRPSVPVTPSPANQSMFLGLDAKIIALIVLIILVLFYKFFKK